MYRFISLILLALVAACSVPSSSSAPKSDYPYVGGDLSGTQQHAVVTGLQGKPVPSPTVGGLQYDGGSYYWAGSSSSSPPFNLYSTRPSCNGGTSGQIFIPSDGPIGYGCNGSAWMPLVPGVLPGIGEVAPLNVSPFTAAHVSSASTATVAGGVISLSAVSPGGGTNFQTQDESYTPGHTVTAWMTSIVPAGARVGIYLSNGLLPSNTNFATFAFIEENGGQQQLNTDNIYYNGSWNNGGQIGPGGPTLTFANNQLVGLRISGSGSNYNLSYSDNGVNWVVVNAVTNMTVYLTPSHCGFFIDSSGVSSYPMTTVMAWANQ